jgi:hypothetical protein
MRGEPFRNQADGSTATRKVTHGLPRGAAETCTKDTRTGLPSLPFGAFLPCHSRSGAS